MSGHEGPIMLHHWCTGSQADLYHVTIYMSMSPTEKLGENHFFLGQQILQGCFFHSLHIFIYGPSGTAKVDLVMNVVDA
ncbi:V-type proton ATPase subunit a1-like isoform X2 [Euphorbia lathyris]|uniref:V-type proton ATPase subunit a1-like isoform X2 n=1 Tax=Euphorbia lathyris TaxID=212925 RepID=UPI0033143B5C